MVWQRVAKLNRSSEELEAAYNAARALDQERARLLAASVQQEVKVYKTPYLFINKNLEEQVGYLSQKLIKKFNKLNNSINKFYFKYFKIISSKPSRFNWDEVEEVSAKKRFALAVKHAWTTHFRPRMEQRHKDKARSELKRAFINNNKYNFNVLENYEPVPVQEYEDEPYTPVVSIVKCEEERDLPPFVCENRIPLERKPRSIMLLYKLKTLIYNCRNNVNSNRYSFSTPRLETYKPQIDLMKMWQCKHEGPSLNPFDDDDDPDAILPAPIEGEGIREYMTNLVGTAVKSSVKEEVTELVQDVVDKISDSVPNDKTGMHHVILSGITNLVHVIINHDYKTMAWSICSFFSSIGLFVGERLLEYYKVAVNIIKYLISKFKTENSESSIPNDQPSTSQATKPPLTIVVGEADDPISKDVASWVSLIFSGLNFMSETAVCLRDSHKRTFRNMFNAIGNSTRNGNFVYSFIKNTYDMIKKMVDYIMCKVSLPCAWIDKLTTEPEILKAWSSNVVTLSEYTYYDKHYCDPNYAEKVADCVEFGKLLIGQIGPDMATHKSFINVFKLYEKICAIQEKLFNLGKHPQIRKMPVTIYCYGNSQVGKSTIASAIMLRLLKDCSIPFNADYLCNVSPIAKHWDQCRKQPCLLIDDMWNIQEGELLDKQIQTLFDVVTSVPLTPVKAAVEDKNMRYNPDIFWMNSNYEYVRFPDVLDDALNGRRDIFIECKSGTKFVTGCPHCENKVSLREVEPSYLRDNHHIEFRFRTDFLTEDFDKQGPWLQYDEFYAELLIRFKQYRTKYLTMFHSRVAEILTLTDKLAASGDYNILQEESILTTFNKFKEEKQRELVLQHSNTYFKFMNSCSKKIKEKYQSIKIVDYFRHKFAVTNLLFGRQVIGEAGDVAVVTLQDRLQQLVNGMIITSEMRTEAILGEKNNMLLNVISDNIEHLLEIARQDTAINFHSWTDFLKYLFEHYDCCDHTSSRMKDVLYDSVERKLYSLQHMQHNLINTCSEHTCIFKSPILKRAYYLAWLDSTAYNRSMYNMKRFSVLPPYFSENLEDMPTVSVWEGIKNYCKSIWECNVHPFLRKCLNFFCKYGVLMFHILTLLIMVGGMVGSLVMGVHAITTENKKINLQQEYLAEYRRANDTPSFVNLPHEVSTAWHESSYNAGEIKKTHIKKDVVKTAFTNSVAEGYTAQAEAAIARVRKNFVKFTILLPTGAELVMHALVIANRTVLFLRHYYDSIMHYYDIYPSLEFYCAFTEGTDRHNDLDGIKFDFRNCKMRFCYTNEAELFNVSTDAPTSHLCYLELPKTFPQCKDLTKFIAFHKDLHSISFDGSLVVPLEQTKEVRYHCSSYDQDGGFVMAERILADGVTWRRIDMLSAWRYGIHKAGWCGSILIANNLQRPIIGIHVAGHNEENFGIAEPLFMERLNGVLSKEETSDIVLPKLLPLTESEINLRTELIFEGVVKPQHRAFNPGKSKIRKSLIHGHFPVTTAVNPLARNDPRLPPGSDPLFLGVEKHGMPTRDFDYKLLNRATDMLDSFIKSQVKPICPLVPLDDQVAVCGNPDILELDALSWDTSPGYPLVSEKPEGAKGKKWLFKLDESPQGYILKGYNKPLLSMIELNMALRKQNLLPFTVFTDCLKDTTLPIAKCSIPGKTRIFSISPVEYTIACRKYLSPFCASYRRARLSAGHGIGITPDGGEWSKLVNKLTSKFNNMFTGDYKNFGPGMNMTVAFKATTIIYNWLELYGYSKDDLQIVRVLLQELIAAKHLCFDTIYYATSGIPSGSPITDILNSLVNWLYILMAWLDCGFCEKDFFLNVRLIVYGDDVIASVSDEYKNKFNSEIIGDFLFKHDIIYTDVGDKGERIPLRLLKDCTFLKRGFMRHPSLPRHYLAPLCIESVYNPCNWIRKGLNSTVATVENIKQALELSFGLGPKFYENFRKQLQILMSDLNMSERLPSWQEVNIRVFKLMTPVVGEMDADRSGEKNDSINVKMNTAIQEAVAPSPVTIPNYSTTLIDVASNDFKNSAPAMTDRWIKFDSKEWTTALSGGQELCYYNLPIAARNASPTFCDVPTWVLFNVSMYSSFNMEIKILLNSNVFQLGSLQAAWIYQDFNDLNENSRSNIWSLSQTMNGVLSASGETQLLMKIPFIHSNPVVFNKKHNRCSNAFNLGTLRVKVLNQLRVPKGGPTSVNCTFSIRLTDVVTTGSIHGSLSCEMETAVATALALQALTTYSQNADNPPLNREPSYMVPSGTHTWCIGTKRFDISKILRLDAKGQTPQFTSMQAVDNFTVSNLCSKYGLMNIVEWKKQAPINTCLGNIPVEPMFGGSVATEPVIAAYNKKFFFPPISVVSSCFMNWRGSIKFKFDIIASKFHTGKLLIAYVPGFWNTAKDKAPTIQQAQMSPYIIIDLKHEQTCTLEVPYVAPTPWHQRYFTGNFTEASVRAPSMLFLYVLNPLILMDRVADTVYINIYAAAGEDFELAIPVQPALGLAWNTDFLERNTYIIAESGYSPYYVGDYGKLGSGKIACLRYQQTSIFVDGVSHFPKLRQLPDDLFEYYEIEEGSGLQYKNLNSTWTPVKFGVTLNWFESKYDEQSWWYMALCPDEVSAVRCSKYIIQKQNLASFSNLFVQVTDTTQNAYGSRNYIWHRRESKFRITDDDLMQRKLSLSPDLTDFEHLGIVGEGDERVSDKTLVKLGASLPTTGSGRFLYGEAFDDLNELCRRMQLYAILQITPQMVSENTKCAFSFTCNPMGLNLDVGNSKFLKETFNRCREGIIPLLLSGYRYFRGGLRFRIVFPPGLNATVWVQHRPDRASTPPFILPCDSVKTAQAVFNHGYAFEVQLTKINSVVEFEVPYYQYGIYGINQPLSNNTDNIYKFQSGLGQVLVGIQTLNDESSKFVNQAIYIYYSLADDFQLYNFYGFPPMCVLDEFPDGV